MTDKICLTCAGSGEILNVADEHGWAVDGGYCSCPNCFGTGFEPAKRAEDIQAMLDALDEKLRRKRNPKLFDAIESLIRKGL